jgi:ketosteroid isomerase-like protein
MRKLVIFAACVVALAVTAAAKGNAADPESVLQAEREWCNAYLKSDAKALESILADDYTLTNSRGEITTKADDVEEARKVDPKYEVFENRDMKVRLYGDTAVVTGRTLVKGTSGGKPFAAEFQFTDTLIRRDGRWRAVAGHVSKIGEKPKG